ncbi:hypothetical protein IC608_09095 [Devosia sp. PTR5]|uniref:Uncharacterized protein n=1 Tax=Devosia oryzisoli TaxID=2774138 RepID=A0A927FX51_9HYPH|nr:hypothetical protein [Devosia oryzisoli]MBD8065631.1 hypothetical protein [Devosia oryzisoli]
MAWPLEFDNADFEVQAVANGPGLGPAQPRFTGAVILSVGFTIVLVEQVDSGLNEVFEIATLYGAHAATAFRSNMTYRGIPSVTSPGQTMRETAQ